MNISVKRLPSAEPLKLESGEDDYEGLLRIIIESHKALPRIQTGALEKALEPEIERIKSEQEKNRKEQS